MLVKKTVKEIADELGVSKQRVMYHVKKLSTKEYEKKDNTIYVSKEGQKAIKAKLTDVLYDSQKKGETDKKSEKLVDKEYIKTLKEQLEKKDIQLAENQKLLDQQQQLHLQANQRIEYLEKQLALDPPKAEHSKQEQSDLEERLKALESENKEYEEANNDFAKVNHQLEEQLEELMAKKWYQFWKRG